MLRLEALSPGDSCRAWLQVALRIKEPKDLSRFALACRGFRTIRRAVRLLGLRRKGQACLLLHVSPAKRAGAQQEPMGNLVDDGGTSSAGAAHTLELLPPRPSRTARPASTMRTAKLNAPKKKKMCESCSVQCALIGLPAEGMQWRWCIGCWNALRASSPAHVAPIGSQPEGCIRPPAPRTAPSLRWCPPGFQAGGRVPRPASAAKASPAASQADRSLKPGMTAMRTSAATNRWPREDCGGTTSNNCSRMDENGPRWCDSSANVHGGVLNLASESVDAQPKGAGPKLLLLPPSSAQGMKNEPAAQPMTEQAQQQLLEPRIAPSGATGPSDDEPAWAVNLFKLLHACGEVEGAPASRHPVRDPTAFMDCPPTRWP